MTRAYNKAPLLEAACEFRFDSAQQWDMTIPGRLYEKLKQSFPEVEQTIPVQVNIDIAGGQIERQLVPAVKFSAIAHDESVQVAPHIISIHQTHPYRNWEHFKATITSVFEAYKVLGIPGPLARIGLRYINRVELPPGNHELDDYFNVMPKVPLPIPQVFQAVLTQVQIPYGQTPEHPDSMLRLTCGSIVPTTPEQFAVILDLDMFVLAESTPIPEDIMAWLDRAHDRIEEAFDAAFTERTHKEIFEEVE